MRLAGTWGRKCPRVFVRRIRTWESGCVLVSVCPCTKKLYLRGNYRDGRPWLRLQSVGVAMYEEAVCEGAHVGGRLCVRKPVCFTNRRLDC